MKWLLALFTALPLLAHGGPITVDFNSGTHGFEFTTECHDGPGDSWGSANFPADGTFVMSTFCPHPGHSEEEMTSWGYPPIGRDYRPQLVITNGGAPFTLLSFEHMAYGLLMESSRGGYRFADSFVDCWYDSEPGCVTDFRTDVTDPLFSNVTWITLCPEGCENGHQVGVYDNFRFWVPVDEPTPLWLLLLSAPLGLLINALHRKTVKWKGY